MSYEGRQGVRLAVPAWLCCDVPMDRTTTTDRAVAIATQVGAARPRRRWSDGPNYPWSPATDDAWSVATHWPALVAVLCEDVAGGTHALARDIERLRTHGKISRADAASMRRTVHAMRAAGMALQQIVRLGGGLHNLSPDRVELADVARGAVRERQGELLRRHIDVGFDLSHVEVWVDGAIAAGLVNAGLDWAMSFSRKVRVKVDTGQDGEPARLVIRGALPLPHAVPVAHGNRRMNDNLHWVLLRQLANCARLPVSRSSTAATESVVVEFPATIACRSTGIQSAPGPQLTQALPELHARAKPAATTHSTAPNFVPEAALGNPSKRPQGR